MVNISLRRRLAAIPTTIGIMNNLCLWCLAFEFSPVGRLVFNHEFDFKEPFKDLYSVNMLPISVFLDADNELI